MAASLAEVLMGSPTPFPSPTKPRPATATTTTNTNSVMLYNGVSNRSRGWKSKRPGDFGTTDGRLTRQPSLKKFDGAARSCSGWDHLRRDPELWFRNGNCYVHLYEKGQSQIGAAFRVPFSSLLTAQCQPLIEKSVDRSVSEDQAYQNGRVDLYMPAPATATSRAQVLQYHVATRNFFAWVFRRSLVGDQLGGAVIALIHSMEEFREAGDHVQDVLEYLDEEGYLDMRNQPQHALAMLHLAEVFEMRELYIDAFAHCVGMSESMYKHPEYSRVNVASRKLMRRARLDMDFRLSRAGAMLGDLLEDELSEAHLGLSTGARAHLDRFRAYVQGFYATKLGAFPPPPAADARCSTIFRPEVYSMLRADFEALYEYLVDAKFTTADNTPSSSQGGLCSLQSVHEFDVRHKFTPLLHPLPLLPEPFQQKASTTTTTISPTKNEGRRRASLPWFTPRARRESKKLRPDQRLVAHAALLRATNLAKKPYLLENRLVLAYRQFEEDTIMSIPQKGEQQHQQQQHHHGRADKKGGVSTADARKVRWLFVYAMHQTLRSCVSIPREVSFTTKVDYHLSVSTKGLPPWDQHKAHVISPVPSFEGPEGRVSQLYRPLRSERGRSVSAVPLLSTIHSPEKETTVTTTIAQLGIEIKPDIDYFALNHQEDELLARGRLNGRGGNHTPTRSRSRSQSLTRSMSIRRSLSLFQRASLIGSRPSTATETGGGGGTMLSSPSRGASTRSSRSSSYHEIIVHGYGNGTNNVAMAVPPAVDALSASSADVFLTTTTTSTTNAATTSRSASTSSATTTSSFSSGASAASTTPTTLVDPQSPTTSLSCNMVIPSVPSYTNLTCPLPRRSNPRGSLRAMYSHDDMLLSSATADVPQPPPLPRRSSRRLEAVHNEKKRWSLADVVASLREDLDTTDYDSDYNDMRAKRASLQPSPLRIRKKTKTTTPPPPPPEDEEGRDGDVDDCWEERAQVFLGEEVSPPCGWEQFCDLGGLQPMHLVR